MEFEEKKEKKPRKVRERQWSEKELWHLHRLKDCKKTTDCGMADCGFPTAMQEMQAYGWVEPFDGGYQITALGRTYLEANRPFLNK